MISQPNKVKTIDSIPPCFSMLQLLQQEAAIFVVNPGLGEFMREVNSAERAEGCNHSHVLVTMYADGIAHRHSDFIPWTKILGKRSEV